MPFSSVWWPAYSLYYGHRTSALDQAQFHLLKDGFCSRGNFNVLWAGSFDGIVCAWSSRWCGHMALVTAILLCLRLPGLRRTLFM